LQPLTKDQYQGTSIYLGRAIALMRIGETGEAISQLEQLLKIPSLLSPNLLRLDPTYAPLRSDPRFQRLIQGS